MKNLKKTILMITSLSLALTMLSEPNIFAEKDISVVLDGTEISFDVEPQIIDGRTMVPLRKIFEEIGALVKWDGETNTITARKSSKTISLSVGSAELNIDKGETDNEGNAISETIMLDVPARIVSGRTLVPARAVSESFGLDVDWDKDKQKVIITSKNDDDDSWKENVGTINLSDLSCTGEGIKIEDNKISITSGGDYTVSGTLDEGNITISTEEKVKIRLSGASITSESEPCIFVEDADKAYITITEGTENTLTSKNNDAISSKDNLEIKGKGTLNISSHSGHGIKASDNLTIENGNINIDAESDGIHVNDTFKMSGGNVKITSVGDGIDSESIVIISGGTLDVETNGTPIEKETAETQESEHRGMWEENTDVEFEKSSKGIKAEWMMCISGGEITVNSASHAIHCQDEIQIDGGNFSISSEYEKGISAHGNLTINGENTIIDIKKSTEGIESKNILTINNGIINVVSTDDAINATGGNSGSMGMPGGGGGFGGNFGDRGEAPNAGDKNGKMPQNVNTDEKDMQKNNRRKNNGMRPNENMSENERLTPPDGMQQNGKPTHPESMPENGNFAPPEGMPENGNFVPPEGMPENDEFKVQNGERPQHEQGGQMPGGRNLKDCLVINGGYLELYAEDDCLDSNGNLIINGGTIKATNPIGSFSGAFAVIDPDGQTIISEKANLVFAAGSGNERNLNLSQNTIIVYCENQHVANDKISISDSNGNVIYDYTPIGSFKTILFSSEDFKTGKTYVISVGDEKYETEITEQITTIGNLQQSRPGANSAWEQKF